MTKIDIWTIGNTGLRSIKRTHEGLCAYSKSSLVGKIHGTDGEKQLESLLKEHGIIDHLAENSDGTYARKWRLSWVRSGFIRCKVKQNDPFKQADIGEIDSLTPLGNEYVKADTEFAQQELYLRTLSIPFFTISEGAFIYPFDWHGINNASVFFSPLLWTLKIMFSLNDLYGDTAISFDAFSLFVQTSCPTSDPNRIAKQIHEYEANKAKSPYKKRFTSNAYELYGKNYPKKNGNFHEYGDMNLRYLRMTGIFSKKGRGIALRKECFSLAKKMLEVNYSNYTLLDKIILLYSIPPLPTDDLEGATASLNDLIAELRERRIKYDSATINLQSVASINSARASFQTLLDRENEERYANNQKNEWKEIAEYLSMLAKGKKYYVNEVNDIEIPSSDAPAYLEWAVWRSLLAIDNLDCSSDKVRSFSVDHDMMPTSTAAGNMPDLIAYYKDYEIVGEVTLSGGSRQEAMEGEPVRRHVANEATISKKKVFGMFIAGKVDTNTAETFRSGVWYLANDSAIELTIVPLTIEQYLNVFVSMFSSDNVSEKRIINLLKVCGKGRESMTAPEWKNYISEKIKEFTK